MLDRLIDGQAEEFLRKFTKNGFCFVVYFWGFLFFFVSRVYFSSIFNAAARPKTAQKKGVPNNNTKAGAFKAQGVALSPSLSLPHPPCTFRWFAEFLRHLLLFFCWLCLLCLLCLGALFNFQSDIWNLKFMLELAVVVAVYVVVVYVVVVAAVLLSFLPLIVIQCGRGQASKQPQPVVVLTIISVATGCTVSPSCRSSPVTPCSAASGANCACSKGAFGFLCP